MEIVGNPVSLYDRSQSVRLNAYSRAREGVIIDDGKTMLFNNLVTLENVILTSRNDVREMENDNDGVSFQMVGL